MKCEPGDLAIVLKCDEPSDAVGRVCTVIKRVHYFWLEQLHGPLWQVLFQSQVKSVLGTPAFILVCPDKWLMPIRPESDPIKVDEQLKVTP